MFKYRKCICSIIAFVCIFNSFTCIAYANSDTKIDIMSLATKQDIANITPYKEVLTLMDDKCLDTTISALIMQTDNINHLKERLNECNIELGPVKKTVYTPSQSKALASSTNLDIDEVELLVYSLKRGGQDYYHLCCGFSFTAYELDPATMDAVVMYFDSNSASYYDYYRDSKGFSMKSGQQANNGTVVFNFKDSYLGLLGDLNYPYTCAVYVVPKSSATEVFYGTDFLHTYGHTDVDLTNVSVGVSFGGTGLVGGSIATNFSLSHGENSWQIGDTNAFSL